jgi:hypothetical protein
MRFVQELRQKLQSALRRFCDVTGDYSKGVFLRISSCGCVPSCSDDKKVKEREKEREREWKTERKDEKRK